MLSIPSNFGLLVSFCICYAIVNMCNPRRAVFILASDT